MKTFLLLFFSFASLAQCATIFTQPLAQITCEGDSIRLICLNSGGSYQWEKRRPSEVKFTSITNARLTRYTFLSGGATHPTGSFYRLKITLGKCITYSDSVLITLRKAPVISSLAVCENSLVPLSLLYRWTINGLSVDSVIATSSLHGSKLKAFARYTTFPAGICILASNEVTLSVTPLPSAPTHAVKLVKGCLGLPITLNATGCSPASTYWYADAGVKLGEGSRISNVSADSSIYRASCVKSGCEGPLSTGVKTAIFPIPEPPSNTSSPSYCSGIPFSLQASGGVNNIWYETATSKSYLSTATALTMKAIYNNESSDSLLVRFASVKINDCESARTPIYFRIKPQLILEKLPTFYVTGERTLLIPEYTISQATLPVKVSYSSTGKSAIGPFLMNGFLFRSFIDSLGCTMNDTTEITYKRNGSVIHHLLAQKETNCLSANYHIKIQGCPLKTSAIGLTKRYESSIADFILSGGQYTFLCNDGETDTLVLNLPMLKRPSSLVRKSFTSTICAEDSVQISIEIDPKIHFIGWEKDGHLFSTSKTMRGLIPVGEYQHVMEENGCFYRSEKIILERRPNPPAPILEKYGAYFVKLSTVGIHEWLIDQKSSSDTSSIRKLTEGREFYARTKWVYKNLACYSGYSNVYYVDSPPCYEFATYPNPSTGLLSIEIAYETDNASLYLYDLKGKLLDSTEIKNSSRRMDWDISQFPAGTYILKLISEGISQEKTIRKSL